MFQCSYPGKQAVVQLLEKRGLQYKIRKQIENTLKWEMYSKQGSCFYVLLLQKLSLDTA